MTSYVTRLTTDTTDHPISHNPAASLMKFIEERQASDHPIEFVLFLGDLCDKANRQGMIYGMRYLNEIRYRFKLPLVTLTGNHDIDYLNRHGADNHLVEAVSTTVPYSEADHYSDYTGQGFCNIMIEDTLVHVLNSMHWASYTQEHGLKISIPKAAIDLINRSFSDFENVTKRIAVCHHHLSKFTDIDVYGPTDEVVNSDSLVEVLDRNKVQLLVHGHKHLPRLKYDSDLPILAAGSLSATTNVVYHTGENLIHIVSLNPHARKGSIETLEFAMNRGWTPSQSQYIRAQTGFGVRSIDNVALQINAWFEKNNVDSLANYRTMSAAIPDCLCLIPSHQDELEQELLSKYNLNISPSLNTHARDRRYLIKE